MRHIVLLLLICCSQVFAVCPGWKLVNESYGSHPPGRIEHRMVYDAVSEYVFLFGGLSWGGDYLNDMWVWDGVNWIRVVSIVHSKPSPRSMHTMAFDSDRGVTILFGGRSEKGFFGDTWEYDGIGWAVVSSNGPSPRSGSSMAFDSGRGVTVLFGGFDGQRLGDTWEWDGVTWTVAALNVGPAPLHMHEMAYDENQAVTVLTGGWPETCCDYGQTWEWDGYCWSMRQASGPRYSTDSHPMMYDSFLAKCVKVHPHFPFQTFQWARQFWVERNLAGAPPPAADYAGVYDRSRNTHVLFGGNIDLGDKTYEWRSCSKRNSGGLPPSP